MKNLLSSIFVYLIIFAVLIGLMFLSSFKNTTEENSLAHVNFDQGFYVFAESTPVADFEMIGTEKITGGSYASFTQVRDVLMKRARKDYPAADGIIFSFPNNATVIKFK